MTYKDLPDNFRDLPLTDDLVLTADVVDLLCLADSRIRGALAILICDAQGRPGQPMLIDEIPADPSPQEARALFEALLETTGSDCSLVVAVCRLGGMITDVDRTWHQTAIDACRRVGVPLIGAFAAAPERVMRLPDPEALAAIG